MDPVRSRFGPGAFMLPRGHFTSLPFSDVPRALAFETIDFCARSFRVQRPSLLVRPSPLVFEDSVFFIADILGLDSPFGGLDFFRRFSARNCREPLTPPGAPLPFAPRRI